MDNSLMGKTVQLGTTCMQLDTGCNCGPCEPDPVDPCDCVPEMFVIASLQNNNINQNGILFLTHTDLIAKKLDRAVVGGDIEYTTIIETNMDTLDLTITCDVDVDGPQKYESLWTVTNVNSVVFGPFASDLSPGPEDCELARCSEPLMKYEVPNRAILWTDNSATLPNIHDVTVGDPDECCTAYQDACCTPYLVATYEGLYTHYMRIIDHPTIGCNYGGQLVSGAASVSNSHNGVPTGLALFPGWPEADPNRIDEAVAQFTALMECDGSYSFNILFQQVFPLSDPRFTERVDAEAFGTASLCDFPFTITLSVVFTTTFNGGTQAIQNLNDITVIIDTL